MSDILVLKTVRNQDLCELIKVVREEHPTDNIIVLSEEKDDFSSLGVTEIKRENGMLNFFEMGRELKTRLKKMKFTKLYLPVYQKRIMFYRHPILLSFYLRAKKRVMVDFGHHMKKSGLHAGFVLGYMPVAALKLIARTGRWFLRVIIKFIYSLFLFFYMLYFFILALFLEIKFLLSRVLTRHSNAKN